MSQNNFDLNIRIESRLNSTQQFLLYQDDIMLNVKNYHVAAWENQHIAPGAVFNVVLPMNIEVGAASALGRGNIQTKLLPVSYNTAWDIVSNEGGLDIMPSIEKPPAQDTIDIHNKFHTKRHAVAFKDGKPLFACEVRPDYKLNFAVKPTLFIALCELEIREDFFDAASLSKNPIAINYEGQSNLNIILRENASTGLVTIDHNFG